MEIAPVSSVSGARPTVQRVRAAISVSAVWLALSSSFSFRAAAGQNAQSEWLLQKNIIIKWMKTFRVLFLEIRNFFSLMETGNIERSTSNRPYSLRNDQPGQGQIYVINQLLSCKATLVRRTQLNLITKHLLLCNLHEDVTFKEMEKS